MNIRILLAPALLATVVLAGCAPGSGGTSESPTLGGAIQPTGDLVNQAADAIRDGDAELLSALIDAGLDANEPASSGALLLNLAALVNNPEAVDLLIAAGGDIEAFDSTKRTPLMCGAVSGGREVVESLLDAGADPYAHADQFPGYAATHLAGQSGNVEALTVFVERGIDLDFRSVSESTALIMAAYTNHPEAVEYLLGSGAPIDINARDNVDATALGWANALGADEVAALLVAAGATE